MIADPTRRPVSPAYTRGQEDFVRGRGWHPRAYSNPDWQMQYDAGWAAEFAALESVRGVTGGRAAAAGR